MPHAIISLPTHLSIDRLFPNLGYCQQCCSEHKGACIFSNECFCFPWKKNSNVEFLDPVVVLFLIFWRTSILFSTVAAPIYIPNSAQGFPFIQIRANTCYLLSFWCLSFWQAWGDSSLWFRFAFLWWLKTWSIFACVVGHLYVFFGKMSV